MTNLSYSCVQVNGDKSVTEWQVPMCARPQNECILTDAWQIRLSASTMSGTALSVYVSVTLAHEREHGFSCASVVNFVQCVTTHTYAGVLLHDSERTRERALIYALGDGLQELQNCVHRDYLSSGSCALASNVSRISQGGNS